MKLHSPGFEKQLRRRVKQAVHSSPELRREFRRANKFRRQYSGAVFGRVVFSACCAGVVWRTVVVTGHPASGLAIVTLWSLLLAFLHGQGLWSQLYAAKDLTTLSLLPVSEEKIFKWELQKFLRKFGLTLLDFLGAYGALALFLNLSKSKWLAVIPLSLLSWFALLALAALLATYLLRATFQLMFAGVFMLLALTVAVGIGFGWQLVAAAIDRAADSLNLFLPTGWTPSLFQLLVSGGRWHSVALLIPISAVLFTLRGSLQRLQSRYDFQERIVGEAPDLLPPGIIGTRAYAGNEPGRPARVGQTEIEEIVESRQFLASPPWQTRGWLEAILWRWFDDREKALADFIVPDGFLITAPWKRIFRNLALALLASLLAGLVGRMPKVCILGSGLFVVLCQAMVPLLATGRAFLPMHCSGVNIPLYAGFGIGFRELARVLFKWWAVQLPVLLPFTIIFSTLLAYLFSWPLKDALVWGAKSCGILLALRFLWVTFIFSSGTNDTSRLTFSAGFLLLCSVVSVLLFVGLAAASLVVPRQPLAWLWLGLAILDAYALFQFYGWFYHRCRFDLMKFPRR